MIEECMHYPTINFSYDSKEFSKNTDARIYKNSIILTPGEYCDKLSNAPAVYSVLELSKGASCWKSNFINLDHSFETLKRLPGYVINPHWNNKAVVGDLHIFPITQAAKDTITLIDAGFINWLSAEIKTKDYWNPRDNKRYAGELEFLGVSVCTHPADTNTRIIPE